MKIKAGFSLVILLMVSIVKVHAQGGLPCGGTDPDATCPLDTWVIVLVIISSAFAAFTLFRKKKSIRA
jgi:hypothetical protein